MADEFDPEEIPGDIPDLRDLLAVDLKYRRIKPAVEENAMGRKWNLEEIHKLAALLFRQDEIAAFLGCSRRTFQRHMDKDEELRDAYDSGKEKFRMTLRRRMVGIAMSRRADAGRMCIWLSKQELGMTDKQDITLSDGTTPGMSGEVRRAAMAELMGEDPNDPEAAMEDDGQAD